MTCRGCTNWCNFRASFCGTTTALYRQQIEESWNTHPLSICVGPCGAVKLLFCCHCAWVCLLQGPENMSYGLKAPCSSHTGLHAVAPVGMVPPGFSLSLGVQTLALWHRYLSACATSWCCCSPRLYILAQGILLWPAAFMNTWVALLSVWSALGAHYERYYRNVGLI